MFANNVINIFKINPNILCYVSFINYIWISKILLALIT